MRCVFDDAKSAINIVKFGNVRSDLLAYADVDGGLWVVRDLQQPNPTPIKVNSKELLTLLRAARITDTLGRDAHGRHPFLHCNRRLRAPRHARSLRRAERVIARLLNDPTPAYARACVRRAQAPPVHRRAITSLDWSPDNTYLLTASLDGLTVRVRAWGSRLHGLSSLGAQLPGTPDDAAPPHASVSRPACFAAAAPLAPLNSAQPPPPLMTWLWEPALFLSRA